jgi:hypothetical protein
LHFGEHFERLVPPPDEPGCDGVVGGGVDDVGRITAETGCRERLLPDVVRRLRVLWVAVRLEVLEDPGERPAVVRLPRQRLGRGEQQAPEPVRPVVEVVVREADVAVGDESRLT